MFRTTFRSIPSAAGKPTRRPRSRTMTARPGLHVDHRHGVVVVAATPLELASRYGAFAGAAPTTISAGLLWWAIAVQRPIEPRSYRAGSPTFMTASAIGGRILVAGTWLLGSATLRPSDSPTSSILVGLVLLISWGSSGMLR